MSRPGRAGNPHRFAKFAKQHQLNEIPFTEVAMFRYSSK